MTRDELLVELSAQVLALPEVRVGLVAVDGMSCVGKSTLARELAEVVGGAGRRVLSVSYDDFHQSRERRHRVDRLSPDGYLADSYDPAALRILVLEPASRGEAVVPASFDLANDQPVAAPAVDLAPGDVVVVEGEFLLTPELHGWWDLSVLLVAEPQVLLERALVRDADLGTAEEIRELYVRRYLGAWALYEERDDPWHRADVVLDLTDPDQPRLLG